MTEQEKHIPRRPSTLADVGRLVGVSAMAASAVLNGSRTSSRISEKTRKAINEAAEQLNYRPNVAARALVNRRMNTLGVTVMFGEGDELNLYFLEVFNGIMEEAMRKKQNTTVFTVSDWEKVEPIAGFCDGRIDGMILVGPLFRFDISKKIPPNTPFLSLHANRDIQGIVNLECDEENGARRMVKHLLDLGHRRIMHVSGPVDLLGCRRRISGFKNAMERVNSRQEDILMLNTDFSDGNTRELFEKWLDDNVGELLPQAIFCVNDTIALACIEVLVGRGYRVPEDVSVCGFDDSLIARSAHLASVRQPLREMGNEAVRLMLQLIDGNLSGKIQSIQTPVIFDTELSIRQSIAAPGSPVTITAKA